MILVRSQKVFNNKLWYATCDYCDQWVKSAMGQFVWTSWNAAQYNAERHRCSS